MAIVRLGTCGAIQPPAALGVTTVAFPGSVFIRRDPDAFTLGLEKTCERPAANCLQPTARPQPAVLPARECCCAVASRPGVLEEAQSSGPLRLWASRLLIQRKDRGASGKPMPLPCPPALPARRRVFPAGPCRPGAESPAEARAGAVARQGRGGGGPECYRRQLLFITGECAATRGEKGGRGLVSRRHARH